MIDNNKTIYERPMMLYNDDVICSWYSHKNNKKYHRRNHTGMAEKEQMKNKQQGRVNFLHSVRGSSIILTGIAMLVLVIGIYLITVPFAQNELKQKNHDYLYDMATAYGQDIWTTLLRSGADNALDPTVLESKLKGVGITGVSSSYAYLVSNEGVMLYHPTADKIGQPVENAVVTGLVGQLQNGVIPQSAVTEYLFKGEIKYAAYYVPVDGSFILVISADESEVMASVHNMSSRTIVFSGAILIIAFLVLYLFLTRKLKAVKVINTAITRMTWLDFSDSKDIDLFSRKKDEFGQIAGSMEILEKKLSETLNNITNQSEKLSNASLHLSESASMMNETTNEVGRAVQEIADGAGNQADETQSASENVIKIGNMIEETNKEVELLREAMREMRNAYQEAEENFRALGEVNEQTKASVEEIAKQTMTTNESAIQIREVTALITDIAEETNLLSLNASIEAARAGEAGRGFAVVASEIQKLADQSSSSAKQIETIIDKLMTDSNQAVQTMDETREIIKKQNENMNSTKDAFGEISEGLQNSVEGIRSIARKVEEMDEARIKVVDTVQNLTAIAEENAAGTQESSASVTQIGSIMADLDENASGLKDIAQALNDEMGRFKY